MAEQVFSDSLDNIDLAILVMVSKSASVREMCRYVDRGVASVHARLRHLEELGLVDPPPNKGMHRSRSVTRLGQRYIHANLGARAI